jgi:Aldo/keto reductases, related to diketogulonate reductase
MVTGKSPVYRLNNGIEMPAFGLGVFRSEPEKTVAAVRSAVANGYRLIDTAAAYMNEQQGWGRYLCQLCRAALCSPIGTAFGASLLMSKAVFWVWV